MIVYEYPFNERVRIFLRLERLFLRLFHFLDSQHEMDHHFALRTLFNILDATDRAELKSDLLMGMDKQRSVMDNLAGNPLIDQVDLKRVLGKIESSSDRLLNHVGKIGQTLRDNDWLMLVKQRSAIAGGVCEIEMPSYYKWLNSPYEVRHKNLVEWGHAVSPVYEAVSILLLLLRGKSEPMLRVAQQGAYQQMLNNQMLAQMIRVGVDTKYNCFPEVSANKFLINLRFSEIAADQSSIPYNDDVSFELTLCNL